MGANAFLFNFNFAYSSAYIFVVLWYFLIQSLLFFVAMSLGFFYCKNKVIIPCHF